MCACVCSGAGACASSSVATHAGRESKNVVVLTEEKAERVNPDSAGVGFARVQPVVARRRENFELKACFFELRLLDGFLAWSVVVAGDLLGSVELRAPYRKWNDFLCLFALLERVGEGSRCNVEDEEARGVA